MTKKFGRHHGAKAALLALFTVSLLLIGCSANPMQQIPPDADLVAEVDLSAQPHDAVVVGEFGLMETAVVTLNYIVPNIDTAVFDLTLSGPSNEYVILHSEDYRTDEDGGGSWTQNLLPGTYRLLLTASQTTGTLSIYWKSE